MSRKRKTANRPALVDDRQQQPAPQPNTVSSDQPSSRSASLLLDDLRPDSSAQGIGGAATSKPSAGRPGQEIQRCDLAPGLYVVATPIGNAADITLRALAVLAGCDAIACEDTRVTARLLAIHNLSRPLLAYHDHNAERALPRLIDRLRAGGRIALVSDAGTPLVSDPGFRLVRACRDAGVSVIPIPGASSVLTALCAAGLPTDRFLFAGFSPVKPGARRRFLDELATVPATLVLFESTQRLAASLGDMAAVLGHRDAAIGRELTKKFEEMRTGTLEELAAAYAAAEPPRGEVTVVIAPPGPPAAPDADVVDTLLRAALADESVSAAAARIATETGLPKRTVYTRALQLAKRCGDDDADGEGGETTGEA